MHGSIVAVQYSIPDYPLLSLLLSRGLTQVSRDLKVTKTINCLISKKKFVVDDALPVKKTHDNRG